MTQPTFSIVLTTFNRPVYLAASVDSVLAQTVRDFELIVVDDGSSPPARVPPGRNIRLIRHNPSRGVAAARNAGLDAAAGEYVCFIDDDDVYDPRRLEIVVPLLGRAPIVLCWFNYIGSKPSGRILEGDVRHVLLATTTPSMGATTVRRDLAARFNASYLGSEDVEWWIRMSKHPVATAPHVGYWVRKHDGPRSGHGTRARLDGSRLMLLQHAEFFAKYPSAAAFRWKRIGQMSAACGDRRAAVAALLRSMSIDRDPRTLVHLVRALEGNALAPFIGSR